MKIALASIENVNGDINCNQNKIIQTLNNLTNKVDLVCFGEAFLHGFDALTWEYEKDKNIALTVDSKYINEIRNHASKTKTAVGFGFFEIVAETIYCSYLVIGKDGSIVDHYQRVSIGWKYHQKTDYHYQEGNGFHSFKFMDKTIVIALCGDLWYQENTDAINEIEKDFVIWPSHLDYSIEMWEKEKNEHLQMSSKVNVPTLFINNISSTSLGGCRYYDKGRVMEELPMGSSGFLLLDI